MIYTTPIRFTLFCFNTFTASLAAAFSVCFVEATNNHASARLETKIASNTAIIGGQSIFTKSGELATDKLKTINDSTIEDKIKYHGFYAVATNSNLSIKEILDINSNRKLIEYCFRLLKSFFDTRPMVSAINRPSP